MLATPPYLTALQADIPQETFPPAATQQEASWSKPLGRRHDASRAHQPSHTEHSAQQHVAADAQAEWEAAGEAAEVQGGTHVVYNVQHVVIDGQLDGQPMEGQTHLQTVGGTDEVRPGDVKYVYATQCRLDYDGSHTFVSLGSNRKHHRKALSGVKPSSRSSTHTHVREQMCM